VTALAMQMFEAYVGKRSEHMDPPKISQWSLLPPHLREAWEAAAETALATIEQMRTSHDLERTRLMEKIRKLEEAAIKLTPVEVKSANSRIVGQSRLPDGDVTYDTVQTMDAVIHRATLAAVFDVAPYPQAAKLRLAEKLERIVRDLRS
jgi:hypothetical protein